MKAIIQHEGTVVEKGSFEHVMALTLNPKSGYREGLIRCITNREGSVRVSGYIDKSQLYKVRGRDLEHFEIVKRLQIYGQKEVIRSLGKESELLGFEDPDIWIDENTGIIHVYFTIPLIDKKKKELSTHLGHAQGNNLDSLKMTAPVLSPTKEISVAKEVSIAPLNKNGTRLNLIESAEIINKTYYSVIRVAVAVRPSESWTYGDLIFHPKENGYDWCNGHASPGPLFPKKFIDVGENSLLGILNGREKDTVKNNKTIYGIFSPGLMIYNYEKGKIVWVSEKPLIRDSKATTITFASQFIQTKEGEGLLYAHVDDSFVRAYTLKVEGLKKLIP